MSKTQSQRRTPKPPQQRKEAYDEAGCTLCGCHVSSSFRNGEVGRICNSCHCKNYRMKRKFEGMASGQKSQSRARVPQPPPQPRIEYSPPQTPAGPVFGGTEQSSEQTASGSPWMQEIHPGGMGHPEAAAEVVAPHLSLSQMQGRVMEQLGGSPQQALTIQHCARRAQQASAFCEHRTVLGVLPSVRLQLPDDPPGLLHSVSCLLEVVASPAPPEEQGADSEAARQEAEGRRAAGQAPAAGGVRDGSSSGEPEAAVRLTVFAAAGAVACWHEGPADPSVALGFSPLTKAPIWTSGPGGFSLHFLGPFCPQVDLFAAIHRYVASAGLSALCHPTLPLVLADAWSWEVQLAATQQQTPFAAQAQQLVRTGSGSAQAAVLQPPPMLLVRDSSPEPFAPAAHVLPEAAAHVQAQVQVHQAQLSPLAGMAHQGAAAFDLALHSLGSLPMPSFPHMPSGPLLGGDDDDDIHALPGLSCFLDHHALE